MLLHPLLSLLSIGLNLRGWLQAGAWSYSYGYAWLSTILAVSSCMALYAVVWLWITLKPRVSEMLVGRKMCSVGVLVFWVYWQQCRD
jgi:hypothetical protein